VEGNDLLPCVDENGVSDVSKMEVINVENSHASKSSECDI